MIKQRCSTYLGYFKLHMICMCSRKASRLKLPSANLCAATNVSAADPKTSQCWPENVMRCVVQQSHCRRLLAQPGTHPKDAYCWLLDKFLQLSHPAVAAGAQALDVRAL